MVKSRNTCEGTLAVSSCPDGHTPAAQTLFSVSVNANAQRKPAPAQRQTGVSASMQAMPLVGESLGLVWLPS
jgi:hypothetical protein